MLSNYVVWTSKSEKNACFLDKFEGVEEDWQLNQGIPRCQGFTKEATFKMDPDTPRNTLLVDNLENTDGLIVGSKRLKEFFEQRGLKNVEYLPVTILDHKNRPTKDPYFIIHPIHLIDCLDLEQCEPEWSSINTSRVKSVAQLVVDESKIDPSIEMFRPKHFFDEILVHRNLAEEIDKQGFTGVQWEELSEYSSDQ